MHQSTPATQFFSMFGGYVPEQHADGMPGNVVASIIDEAVTSLTVSMFSEVLQSLRAALCVNAGRMV
jgi:hypothetical protein